MLDHPFGPDKKRLLKQLQHHYQDSSNGIFPKYVKALFPELYLVHGFEYYVKNVIKPFDSTVRSSGDQTSSVIKQASCDLRAFDNMEQSSAHDAYVVEAMQNTMKSSAFLASHYYYHAMFHWFWRMFRVASATVNLELCNQASDIAFFEGTSLKLVKNYLIKCSHDSFESSKIQRLWNKLAVQYALRQELSEASSALTWSEEFLHQITDSDEMQCRKSELHNAKALLFYKSHDYTSASSELQFAYKCLDECSPDSQRVSKIRRLLDTNQKRLQLRSSPNGKA